MAKRATKAVSDSGGIGIGDTLINLMMGLGTEKDKLRGTQFGYNGLDKGQLDKAYRGDWIARKIVDIPAYDSFREWRTWDVDTKEADRIRAQEKTLKIQRKSMLAEIRGRLYGGGALILGVDQGSSEEPLDYDTLKIDCLKFVHSVSRYDLSAGQINKDILSPYYGEPEYYTISSLQEGSKQAMLNFHPSRVVRFTGMEHPDPMQDQGWGDSVISIVADAVMGAGLVSSSVAQLVAEAKVDVMHIPNMTKNMATAGYEQRLIKRVATANLMKSSFSVLVMDKEEDWDRIKTTFDGLTDIAKFYMMLACGAADIPATRFLGQPPQGLNATGESDIRNYYDSRKTDQSLRISPSLERLDKVLMISALGTYDDKITYSWDPLWQLSEAEKADVASKKAATFKVDVDAGLINDVVLKKAREAQLVEDDTYPGLADIIEEFDDDPELENEANNPPPDTDVLNQNGNDPLEGVDPNSSGQPSGQRGASIKAADLKAILGDKMLQPKPLYVYREVLNKKDIIAWAKSQGFDSIIDDLHVTIIWSKAAVDWLKAGDDTYGYSASPDGTLTVKAGGPRVIQVFGKGIVVLAFANNDLAYRHSSIMYRCEDATWEFDDYTPHISITYNAPADMVIDDIEPYRGVIQLGPEIFETIDPTFNNETDVVENEL